MHINLGGGEQREKEGTALNTAAAYTKRTHTQSLRPDDTSPGEARPGPKL